MTSLFGSAMLAALLLVSSAAFAAGVPGSFENGCPARIQNKNLGCNPDDIELAEVEVVGVAQDICYYGDPIDVTLDMHMIHNRNKGVYDVSVWVATDGGNIASKTGAEVCEGKTITAGLLADLPPNDLMTSNIDGDSCPDTESDRQEVAFTDQIGAVTLTCKSEGTLDAVVGWQTSGKDSDCGDSDELANFGTAQCALSQQVAVDDFDVVGTLTVCKDANPDTEQLFSFTSAGAYVEGSLVKGPPLEFGGFFLYDDGECVTMEGYVGPTADPVVITELDIPKGYYLAGADCLIDGSEPTAQAAWNFAGEDAISVQLTDDQPYVTCYILNDKNPSLTLRKTVVNDNGGTAVAADFDVYIGTEQVEWEKTYVLEPGGYTVSETPLAGYSPGDWGGDCSATGTITLEEGAYECTITNDDIQPQLTVTKVVTNDDGGTKVVADFPLFVDATQVTSGVKTGFNVGAYVVSETEDTNYTATIGGDCDADGNVSLALADDKSCTITNNDNPPTLTLKKVVINDDGGEAVPGDFPITLTGNDTVHNGGVDYYDGGTAPAIRGTVQYTITEDPLPGYRLKTIECVLVTGGPIGSNGVFTAVSGQAVECTVTNDDYRDAYFLTRKDFSDNNPALVDVEITCNTGLPLKQTFEISEGDPVNFVVTDFPADVMDCVVKEVDGGTAGYKTTYTASITDGDAGDVRSESDGCYYDNVGGGQFDCLIKNELLPVTLTVGKEWVVGDPGLPVELKAKAKWECFNIRDDAYDLSTGTDDGKLHFEGASDSDVVSGLFPDYDGSTYCTVSETWAPSQAEVDESDCADVELVPGSGNSCTIYNTVFFEGIPTLNQYGLALLALLMLGVGFVGFRRLS